VDCQPNYPLPPLGPLIGALSDSDGIFNITDSTDYDTLTSCIAVLSVALSGIESYVAEEIVLRKLAHAAGTEGSPRKKEPLPLELVKTELDLMHGKIGTCPPSLYTISLTKGFVRS
jgi:hypothetical protein